MDVIWWWLLFNDPDSEVALVLTTSPLDPPPLDESTLVLEIN